MNHFSLRSSLFLLLFMASAMVAPAQKDDEKARLMITELAGKIRSYKNMRIEFAYKMDNETSKIHESKQGTLLVEGERYRLNIAGQVIINDGKALFTYMPEAKEVQINPVDEDSQSITPTGILADYEKKYRVKYIREENQGVRKILVADLLPIEGKKFYKVRIKLDTRTKQPVSFAMFDKNGTTFTYDLNRLDANVTMKPGLFEFKAADYPGVEVVDMR